VEIARVPGLTAFRARVAPFARSKEGLLVRRLLLVLGVYTVARLVFLIDHAELFRDAGAAALLGAFVRGVRFDLSAIAYSNLPFILLSLAPAALLARRGYQRLLLSLFVLVNGAMAIIMFGDIAYFPFTGTRVTLDVFAFSGEAATQAPQLLKNYAALASLTIGLIVALGVFFPRAPQGPASERSGGAGGALGAEQERAPRRRWITPLFAALVVVLTGIAARGGLQKKPLKPIHAFAQGEHTLGVLALNSAFTLIHSPTDRQLSPVKYFQDDREAEAVLAAPFGYTALATTGGLPQRQNVVLIVLESVGVEFWGARDRDVVLTPFLDSLAGHGVFYRNGFSNGRRSMDALPSILLGVPLLMGRSVAVSAYQGNEWHGLGDLLGANGYRSAFFHGAVKGTMFFDAIAGMAGIETFLPLESFPDSVRARDFDGHWGLYDEPAMQWAAEEMGRLQEPFFSVVFTISTHHPYQLPPAYEGVYPEHSGDLHASVRYLDHAVRRFFERAQGEPWYDNTLFILTGDHTAPDRSIRFDTDLGRFMVPTLLFHPKGRRALPPLDAARITQHVDLFPTILDYTGSTPGRIPLFGRSLFSGTPGEAILQSNDIFWLVRRDAVLQREPNGSERVFALEGERSGGRPPSARGAALAPELRRRLDAYVQHYANGMIRNTFFREPAPALSVPAAPPAVP
jgi:phosphoglycerol transferase MdoB-like AlkP superfamily enzyme